jgi:uncharacterized membrane protein YbhN (UPF0104 family)
MLQDKQLPRPNEKTGYSKLWWVLKLFVTGLVLSYIFSTFQNEQKSLSAVGSVLRGIMVPANAGLLALLLALVPLNWALESLKWQRLARKAVPVSFREAFRSTLTGLAVGVAVPAQLGDTLGRVASLRSKDRLLTIGAAVVSNGIQFYVSLVVGLISWVAVGGNVPLSPWLAGLVGWLLLFLVGLGPVVAWNRKRLTAWKSSHPLVLKMAPYFQVISRYSARDLAMALLLGGLRYLVFLFQFVLALSLFDFNLTLTELTACVGLILLAKTLIPALNVLGDLGLREFSALFLLRPYGLPPEQIITATLLVWAINILGPLVVGLVLVWQYKWTSSHD